jgi:hypothetical protein
MIHVEQAAGECWPTDTIEQKGTVHDSDAA